MKSPLDERRLQGWKFVARFLEVLEMTQAQLQKTPRKAHGLRKLQAPEYLALFLSGLFNPVIISMRGLCRASELPRVQREVAGGRVVLSRFSEAQAVFDPELLRRSLSDLVSQSVGALGASRGGFPLQSLRIIDSTLWKVGSTATYAEGVASSSPGLRD